jgi:hypothetical protein
MIARGDPHRAARHDRAMMLRMIDIEQNGTIESFSVVAVVSCRPL